MFARYRTFISCLYIVICVSPFLRFSGKLTNIYISLIIYIVSPIKSVKLCFHFHIHILLLLFVFLRIYFVDSNNEYVFISNADKTNLIVSPLKNTSFFYTNERSTWGMGWVRSGFRERERQTKFLDSIVVIQFKYIKVSHT